MWPAHAQPTGSISPAIDRLRIHIVQIPERLTALSEDVLTQKTPGKWSRKEILGHLIDSAVNNLKRFTDAQYADEFYTLQGYNQDKLVAVNHYQDLPLAHLLTLWSSLNTQIVFVAASIPADVLGKKIRFNQDSVSDQTLSWLVEDYVAHLEHHLKTLV